MVILNKENCEEHPRSKQEQNSIIPRSQEDYITQVFEEIEGIVTKKLSHYFSKMENCILGALSRLDDSHELAISGPLRNHSGDVPECISHKPGNK